MIITVRDKNENTEIFMNVVCLQEMLIIHHSSMQQAAQKIRIEKVLPHPTLMGPMGISAKSPSFPGCCSAAGGATFYSKETATFQESSSTQVKRKVYKMPSWPALKSFGLPAMLTFWARTGKSACFHFGPLVLQEKEEHHQRQGSSSFQLQWPSKANSSFLSCYQGFFFSLSLSPPIPCDVPSSSCFLSSVAFKARKRSQGQ